MHFSGINYSQPLEEIHIYTALGIRFWDPVRNIQVRDHLVVTALREGKQDNPIQAHRTASGIYSFHGLPGVLEERYGRPEPDRIGSPPDSATLVINVSDLSSRFLPVTFSIDLPLNYKGPFLNGIFKSEFEDYLRNTSPPRAYLPGFLLFSAPERPICSSLAVIRATIVDHISGAPAAHAVMQIQFNGNKSWYGIADENGNILAPFSYPKFEAVFHDSPPPGGFQIESPDQRWDLSIRIKYDPDSLIYRRGARLPDFRSILGQMEARIWTVSPASVPGREPVEQWDTRLTIGKELVLKTQGEPNAILLVDRNISH